MHDKSASARNGSPCLSHAGGNAPPEGTIWPRSHLAKACGQTIFPSDFSLPGLLVGGVLRSPHAHCHINAIHTDKARALPGIHAVLTAEDIPGTNKDIKTLADQPFLAEDRARTVTDALALVAAETQEAADAALEAIELDLTPLPAVFDADAALAPDAPMLHANGNLAHEFRIVRGDAHAAMGRADAVIEGEYLFPLIDHAYLETEVAVAALGKDGTMTVWRGSHDIYSDRLALSRGFGWPEDRFRVILLPPGGSFGGKHSAEGFFAALLAFYTRRPVRVQFSRTESLRYHAKRSPMRVHHRLGAFANGRLAAVEVQITSDTGAYVHWAPLVLDFCCIQAVGPYRVPHASVYGRLVYTNNVIGSAMRALGTPQVEFAAESQMDRLAERLGIHPLRLRWINALRDGDTMVTGRLPPGCNFADTLVRAARSIGLDLEGNSL